MNKIIGNILTNQKMVCPSYLNITNDFSCIKSGVPTLIIGYDLTKEFFDSYISIRTNHLVDGFYWTFSKFEDNSKYMVEYEAFLTMCLEGYVNSYKYIYIDPIHYNLTKIKKILKKIFGYDDIVYFVCDGMVYLYVGEYVFGINLEICSYVGVSKDKIINKVKGISSYGFEKKDLIYKYDDIVWRLRDYKFYLVLFNFLNQPT